MATRFGGRAPGGCRTVRSAALGPAAPKSVPALSVTLLLLALTGGEASAQYAPPPAPLPPPPPAPEADPAAQPPPPVSYDPAPARPRAPRRHRRQYRPGRLGRFYLGGGAGYVWPRGQVGKQLDSGMAYGAWLGWRKRWIGVELGYLGARLGNEAPPVITTGNSDNEPSAVEYVTYDPNQARISHVTADIKLFLTVFCRASLFARVGVNYTHIGYSWQPSASGYGYQYGGGVDVRIRLSHRPDWVLKLRAEVVNVSSAVKTADEIDRRSFSGLYAMLYVNLGWAPR